MSVAKSFAAFAGAILLALATTAALANPDSHSRDRERDEKDRDAPQGSRPVQHITISSENGEIKISSVVIVTDAAAVLAALTEGNARQEGGNKVDLSGLPLIGGLFGGQQGNRPAEPVAIGHAHILGPTLAIDLRAPQAATVVVTEQPAPSSEEKRVIGEKILAEIKKIRGDGVLPGSEIIHHVEDSAYRLDGVQIRDQDRQYSIPASAFSPIGSLGNPPPEAAVNEELVEELKEFERLLGQPSGQALLEQPNLAVVTDPAEWEP